MKQNRHRIHLLVADPPPTRRRDLHISRRARERFGLDDSLFSLAGNVIFADVAAARRLAETLAAELARVDAPASLAMTPAKVYALGLIHELLHRMIDHYREAVDQGVLLAALDFVAERLGSDRLERALLAFAREFPPVPVWKGEATIDDFLAQETAGRSNREVLLEEMLILWLANSSPAFAPFRELFDDGPLRRESAYPEVIATLEEFFETEPEYPAPGPESPERPSLSLIAALQAPARAEPTSLSGQLRALAHELAPLPPPGPPAARVMRGADLLREEERPVFPPGPGPVEAPSFEEEPEGPEQFSVDTDWMPKLVLLAKNALVWLAQLSEKYGRSLTRLDEIPEAELELAARRGFTGLWLIGLWQRSAASQRIKQATGNPEAAASAYALSSYSISSELGGEEALEKLKRRASRHGIRLACDMVPNHFGIDSEWVLEFPERFIQLPTPPYPSYRFDGPDLSHDPKIGIFLEDHYYDKSDAAVVFRRLDRETGEATYLYHGNDGTVTPWNDTAQLDYAKPEVRQAVVETILEVARRFPIIRFDAAMTLARRHVRRLWYPPPGAGGAIPSRSEHGLTEEEFDLAMPQEFWREVVDTMAAELPDTLLLAEAFWLMESYFVRTLGMHRVYNSAFMIMLRDERNADYRLAIRNVLAFEPEILKRYVNFMSNPDERTAVDQFGTGDKYFGVATLLATLPGLPMFGHGQLEGLAERYGMEYSRAYHDEQPDPWVLARHERQIVPLLARRALFAGSEHFVLYDFEKSPGVVDEDVFAFTNQLGDERSLVVFHNRPGPARGRLRRSVPIAFKVPGQEKPHLRWETLAHALGVEEPDAEGRKPLLISCRDLSTGREHLFFPNEVTGEGLLMVLGGYECHVFTDFVARTEDENGAWTALGTALAGRGVPSLADALLEPQLEAVLGPARLLFDAELLHRCVATSGAEAPDQDPALLADVGSRLLDLLRVVRIHLEPASPLDEDESARLEGLALERSSALGAAVEAARAAELGDLDRATPATLVTLYSWSLLSGLDAVALPADPARPRVLLDDLLLGKVAQEGLKALGASEDEALSALVELKVLLGRQLPPLESGDDEPWRAWFALPDARLAVRVNRFEGWTYFHRESFERLLAWAALAAELAGAERAGITAAVLAWKTRGEQAGYRLEALLPAAAVEVQEVAPDPTASD